MCRRGTLARNSCTSGSAIPQPMPLPQVPVGALYISSLCLLSRMVFGHSPPLHPTPYTITFIKIAISFTSLIPCPIPPTDNRETTERRAKRYRALAAKNSALFLRLSPKKVDLIPEKVVSMPKTVDLHFSPLHSTLYILHQKNRAKTRFFLHISKKKCIFAPKYPKELTCAATKSHISSLFALSNTSKNTI